VALKLVLTPVPQFLGKFCVAGLRSGVCDSRVWDQVLPTERQRFWRGRCIQTVDGAVLNRDTCDLVHPFDDCAMMSGEIGIDPPWMDSDRAYFTRVASIKFI